MGRAYRERVTRKRIKCAPRTTEEAKEVIKQRDFVVKEAPSPT
jgi:hypothetical protein